MRRHEEGNVIERVPQPVLHPLEVDGTLSLLGDHQLLRMGQWGVAADLAPGGNPNTAVTLLRLESRDKANRPFTVFFSGPPGGVDPTGFFFLPVARLRWGSSGFFQSAEIDVVTGRVARVSGWFLQMDAFNEATGPNAIKVNVGAAAGIGFVGGNSPTRTKYLTLAASTPGIVATPNFARNVQLFVSDPTSAYFIELLDRAGNVITHQAFAAGALCPEIRLSGNAFAVRVQMANAATATVVFEIEL